MRIRTRLAAMGTALAALLSFLSCSSSPRPPIRDPAALASILESELAACGEPSAAMAIVYGSEPPVMAAAGRTLLGGGEPVTTRSLYHLGSVTKSFTAMLVASLVEEGRLSYDTSLEAALPGVPMREEYRPATVEDLMASRAGIIAFQRTDLEDPAVVRELWEAIPARHPGDAVAQRAEATAYVLSLPPLVGPDGRPEAVYSNASWAILGRVAEMAAGESYEAALARRVLAPLGIERYKLGGWPSDDYSSAEPVGHFPAERRGSGPTPQSAEQGYAFPGWMNSAGGLSLDLVGFARYAADQLGGLSGRGAALEPEGYAAIHSVRSRAVAGRFYLPASADASALELGMGWALCDVGDGYLSLAEGTGGTYYAVVLVYPGQGVAVVGLVNSGSGLPLLERAFERSTGMRLAL